MQKYPKVTVNRPSDVAKHSERIHKLSDVTLKRGQEGCRWGLMRYQNSYCDVGEDVIEYPRAEETMLTRQQMFLNETGQGVTSGGDRPKHTPKHRSPQKLQSIAEKTPGSSVTPARKRGPQVAVQPQQS